MLSKTASDVLSAEFPKKIANESHGNSIRRPPCFQLYHSNRISTTADSFMTRVSAVMYLPAGYKAGEPKFATTTTQKTADRRQGRRAEAHHQHYRKTADRIQGRRAEAQHHHYWRTAERIQGRRAEAQHHHYTNTADRGQGRRAEAQHHHYRKTADMIQGRRAEAQHHHYTTPN
jgi:hypothetical protein